VILIIPLAGRGSRFAGSSIQVPKPLIPVLGKPMLVRAFESVRHVSHSKSIFIALREHEKIFGISKIISDIGSNNSHLILIDRVTEGQLCTVLEARSHIETDEDILIASADTYVISNLGLHIHQKPPETKGIISVANLPGEQWSFAQTDESGRVIRVSEKVRISDHASTGLYYFSNGNEFLKFSEEIINNGEKTRGEYYIIPIYQKYIDKGFRIDMSIAESVWDMGNPSALEKYLEFLSKN
jgi:UDP-N-acetylglucosamine diphosphorylase / glucose-1-phosphate thymidylyltransferase / UDP-N-acetylgalactosamine diphosphorylase / glucosamine-1-phosphate N-acetyltransferase / galactosamine-1-phosphate N-acetyltransferase